MLYVGVTPSVASSAHIGVAPPRGYGGYCAGGAHVAQASLRLGEEARALRAVKDGAAPAWFAPTSETKRALRARCDLGLMASGFPDSRNWP